MTNRPDATPHPKPVLGLLGAPGSGKSTVAAMFAELGCGVIDADKLAHDAIQTPAVRAQLQSWWGDAVIDPAGSVDRHAVGRIVFNQTDELKKLEHLLHPIVAAGRQKLREQFFSDSQVVAVIEDCPLLLETGLESTCDWLVFIECPFEVRLRRVARSRGWDADELRRRDQRQIPLDIKQKTADDAISNVGDPARVREQVAGVFQRANDQLRPA